MRVPLLAICLLSGVAASAEAQTVVYRNDFEESVGPEWAAPRVLDDVDRPTPRPPRPGDPDFAPGNDVGPEPANAIPPIVKAPNGSESYLGEFNNHQVRLTLSDLPAHNRLRVAFNFIPIRSWDGSASLKPGTTTKVGPDQFSVKLTGDRTLFTGTFCNHDAHGEGWQQTYPGILPDDVFPAGTGRVGRNTYGYSGPAETTDSTYYIETITPHTSSVVQIVFEAEGLQRMEDESWAIDNVVVEVFNIEDVPELGDAMFQQAWDDLAGEDAIAAWSAAWTLIPEGNRILPRIRRALANDPVEDNSEMKAKVDALVADLDGDDYYKARDARKALREMGAEALPFLREHVKSAKTREARVFLAKLVTDVPVDPFADPIVRRRARLTYVLRTIKTPEAEQLIKQIEG